MLHVIKLMFKYKSLSKILQTTIKRKLDTFFIGKQIPSMVTNIFLFFSGEVYPLRCAILVYGNLRKFVCYIYIACTSGRSKGE